jgi:hypothetical protein
MKENEQFQSRNIKDSVLRAVRRIFRAEQPQPPRHLESTEPAEKEWVEIGPTGIYSPHKTITIHRETRIAVERYQKNIEKTLAEMRKIEERQKEDKIEQARLFDEMRNMRFRQHA